MARRGGRPDAVKVALEELHAVRAAPTAEAARRALAAALASRSSFVVEAAARIVGEHELAEHAPALAAAYPRFPDATRDPGCRAKTAVVEALARLAIDAPEIFLAAVRHRQLEPAFGGPVDTAVALRAHAAAGLAQAGHPAAAVEAAVLLADREWDARAGAARAVGLLPPEVAEPVLRHKIAAGDAQPQVIGECLRSLLALSPGSVGFVATLLRDADADRSEQAALALGDSRLEAAFDALRGYVEEEAAPERRRAALIAVGLLRRDAAVDWLLARVAEGDAAAVDALAIYRHDARVRALVIAAATDARTREAAARVFG